MDHYLAEAVRDSLRVVCTLARPYRGQASEIQAKADQGTHGEQQRNRRAWERVCVCDAISDRRRLTWQRVSHLLCFPRLVSLASLAMVDLDADDLQSSRSDMQILDKLKSLCGGNGSNISLVHEAMTLPLLPCYLGRELQSINSIMTGKECTYVPE